MSLKKDPEKCVVEELRRWLECHGVKKTEKRCIDLKGEGFGFAKPPGRSKKLTVVSGKTKNLPQKLSDQEIVCCPPDGRFSLPRVCLRTYNNTKILQYGHVYFHLVESTDNLLINDDGDGDEEIGGLTLTTKPLCKGRELVNSGFV